MVSLKGGKSQTDSVCFHYSQFQLSIITPFQLPISDLTKNFEIFFSNDIKIGYVINYVISNQNRPVKNLSGFPEYNHDIEKEGLQRRHHRQVVVGRAGHRKSKSQLMVEGVEATTG